MDSVLYYKIYGERVDKPAVSEYTGYTKSGHLYNLIKNHVRRAQPKIENKRKALIFKIN